MENLIDLLRSLGASLLEVLRAELAALQADLQRSGHFLWVGLAFLGAAAGVLFWTFGLLLFTIVTVLAIWLPLWGAALITVALFAAAAGVLVALGVSRLRRLENPATDVKRRLADHLDWWQNTLLAEPRLPPPAAAPALAEPPSGDQP
jgi:hypothetical protein